MVNEIGHDEDFCACLNIGCFPVCPGCDRCVPADQPAADDVGPGATPDDLQRRAPQQTIRSGLIIALYCNTIQ